MVFFCDTFFLKKVYMNIFSCVLCEKETVITVHLCEKCRRIKHLLNLYDDKVYTTLENCLVRNDKQINSKIDDCIKKEKEEIDNTIKTRSQTKNN